MEIEKCGGEQTGCNQAIVNNAKEKNPKKGKNDGGEGSALSETNDGQSKGGNDQNYGKSGIGSSVELTDMGVEGSGKCEWGNWGDWNTCRGPCKNGSRSRTRACKRSSADNSETYSVFRSIRAVGEQCQCDGESVETESCKPKVYFYSRLFFSSCI
jgi:hypothetical protein